MLLLFLLSLSSQLRSTYSACAGGFDIYFVLDQSGSLKPHDFQVDTVRFVRNLTRQLNSQTTRVSIVSFADSANMRLPLTGDRNKIEESLKSLQSVNPKGSTLLHTALDKVTAEVKNKGASSASIMIVVTDGEIQYPEDCFKKSAFLRDELSVMVFAVGVSKYKIEQLNRLASLPTSDHVFTTSDFQSLMLLSNRLIQHACVEVISVQPSSVCPGISNDVTLHGNGFVKVVPDSSVVCNFRTNDTVDHVVSPTYVSDTRLICRPPILTSVGAFFTVQVSVQKDKFVSSDLRISAIRCRDPDGKPVAIAITVLILLFLLITWWFYLLTPCANVATKPPPPRRPPPPVRPPPPAVIGKWPTVDASFYGGGGIGGIKPVRVQWGDMGATEEGNKLTKTPDAKVVDHVGSGNNVTPQGSRTQPERTSTTRVSATKSDRLRQVFGVIRRVLFLLWRGLLYLYKVVASFRPHKGGNSKFYTNCEERKVLYA